MFNPNNFLPHYFFQNINTNKKNNQRCQSRNNAIFGSVLKSMLIYLYNSIIDIEKRQIKRFKWCRSHLIRYMFKKSKNKNEMTNKGLISHTLARRMMCCMEEYELIKKKESKTFKTVKAFCEYYKFSH